MADLEKKIVLSVEADPKKADAQVDKFKKEVENKGVQIPVDIDLSDITKALKGVEGFLSQMYKAFDKDVKFSGMQKGLDNLLEKLDKVTGYIKKGTPDEIQMFRVDVNGLKKLTDATNVIKANVESLNENRIDVSSFDKLENVLKNIEGILTSISDGLNFEKIRPSAMVQSDIEKTTKKLEELAAQEEKITKLEHELANTGVKKGKKIIEFGDSEDVNALGKLINQMKEYISLGGDLSKIQFKYKASDDLTKQMYSLMDVFEILEDEGKIDLIDESEITNDVSTIKTLRNELSKLNDELANAQIRENRDLNVSLDTKSVEDFSKAIATAVEKIGELHFDIPEGFTFEGLSVENLEKIIGKLDEIVTTIQNIGTLLTTGVDFSKLNVDFDEKIKEDKHAVRVEVSPDVDADSFATRIESALQQAGSNGQVGVDVRPSFDEQIFVHSIEEQIASSGEKVKVKSEVVVNEDEQNDNNIINHEALTEEFEDVKQYFQDLTDDFGYNLTEAIAGIKEDLEATAGQIDYENLFSSLRESLLDIVKQFQTSLNNVSFSKEQTDEIYNLLQQWNEASDVLLKSGKQDSERAALFNKGNGSVSNSYLFDKEGEFAGKLLDELNKLGLGISGQIGEVYDTWVHTHPLQKAREGLKTIGSDIGFSAADLEIYKKKYLSSGVTNMMVANNGKYANINWEGVSREIIDQVIRSFKSSDIFKNGKFVANDVTKNGVYDYDKQSETINNAIIKAMSDAGIQDAKSRVTTGNISELKTDVSALKQEEQEAAVEAQELLGVLNKISDALNGVNQSDSFKIEGIDTLMTQLNEVKTIMSEITDSLNNNFKLDSNVLNDFLKDDSIKEAANQWVNSLSNAIELALATNSPFDSLQQAAYNVLNSTQNLQDKMNNLGAQSPIVIDVSLNTVAFGWDYDEIKEKIERLAEKDIVINIKGLLDETIFGMSFSGHDEKAKRERDLKDLDYIVNTVRNIPELFEYFKSYGKTMFDSSDREGRYWIKEIERFGFSIDKLTDALKNTGFADANLNPTFSIPDSGAQHSLGVVGQNYVLLGRDEYQPVSLESAKIKQAKIDELADMGVNIARIVLLRAQEAAYDTDTHEFIEVQERKSGQNHRDVYHDFLNMNRDQMVDFLRDMKAIFDQGLAIELRGDNLLFDPKTGVTTPIDLLTPGTYHFEVKDLERFVNELAIRAQRYGDFNFGSNLHEVREQVENEGFVRKPVNQDGDAGQGIGIGLNPLMNGFMDKIQSQVDGASPIDVQIAPKINANEFITKVQSGIDKIFKPDEFINPATGEVFQSQEEFLNAIPIHDFTNLDSSDYTVLIKEIRDLADDAAFEVTEQLRNKAANQINDLLDSAPELQEFFPKISQKNPSQEFFMDYHDFYSRISMAKNDFDFDSVGEVVTHHNQKLQQAFEKLGNVAEAPKIKVEPQIDTTDFVNKIEEQLKGVSVDINVNPNKEVFGGDKQVKLYDELGREIDEVNSKLLQGSHFIDEQTGNLKILYHGSSLDFDSFDPAKMNDGGLFGKAAYLTTEKDNAEQYGQVITEWFVSVNKIFDDASQLSEQEIRTIFDRYYVNIQNILGDISFEDFYKKINSYDEPIGYLRNLSENIGLDRNSIPDIMSSLGYGGVSSGSYVAIFDLDNITKANTALQNTENIIDDITNQVISSSINTSTDVGTTGMAHESEQAETLRNKITEVATAVDAKTNAFREEEQVVVGTVQREVSSLEILDGQLLEIINTLERIKSTPVNINLNLGDGIGENNNITTLLSDLGDKVKSLDVESLSKFATALKELKVGNKSAENLELVAVALSEFKTSLNGISADGKSFLDSINAITSRTSELQDLAKILESTSKKIKEAGDVTKKISGDTNDDAPKKKQKSDDDIQKDQAAIRETSQAMEKLRVLGNGDVFSEMFGEASTKIDALNQQLLEQTLNLSEYKRQVKEIQNELKGKLNVVEMLAPDDIEAAKIKMEEYARVVSDNQAVFKSGTDIGDKVTYTWTDQNNIVHNLTLSYDKLTGAMSEVHKHQKKTERQTKSLSESLKQGWLNVRQYVMSFVGFYEIVNWIRQGVTVIRDLDTALTEMRKVSDESVDTLKEFQKVSFDIADAVGTTAKQIQNSTADWMRLGESMQEAAESAKVANILLNVSEFSSIDEATESLVSMSAAYDELDKIDIVDKLNQVGNNFSISTDGLATALQKSASALTTAGNDIDEAIAIITAGNAVVQDADSVGTGMQTIALRLTGTKEASEQLEALGEDADGVITTVSKLRETIMSATAVESNNFQGFDILDENGNYKSTYDIMVGLSEVYEEIAETDKKMGSNNLNLLLETIAGKRRANIAASILQNEDLLKSVYESSANDSRGSAEKELEKYLDSIEGKINQFQNEVQEFWYNLISSDTVKGIVDIGTKLMDFLGNSIDTIEGKVISLAAVIGTVFAAKKITNGGGRAKKSVLIICHRAS